MASGSWLTMGAIPIVLWWIGVSKSWVLAVARIAACCSFKPAEVIETGRLLTEPTNVGLVNNINNADVARIPENAKQLVADNRVPRLSIGLLNCKYEVSGVSNNPADIPNPVSKKQTYSDGQAQILSLIHI